MFNRPISSGWLVRRGGRAYLIELTESRKRIFFGEACVARERGAFMVRFAFVGCDHNHSMLMAALKSRFKVASAPAGR